MEENVLFDNRYKLEKLLGRGSYSEVWLANDEKTNVKVALKIFAPSTGLDEGGLQMFSREFSLVADVNSPYILKPLYFESEGKPYLVLQYCKEGSIKSLIGNTDEEEVWKIILEVAKGLKELHSHKPNPIVHQDIKPDNIMMSDAGHYMITDFGISVHLHSELRKTVSSSFSSAGTKAYMAPERFGKKRLTPIMASDVWSLGATVFELLSSDVPFGEEGGLFQKSGVDVPELPGNYSAELQKTIEKCLSCEPWTRPSVEELIDIAQKALSRNDFSKDEIKPDNDNIVQFKKKPSRWKPIMLIILSGIVGVACGVALAFI